MLNSSSRFLTVSALMALSLFAAPLAAQEAQGISVGPGTGSTFDGDRGAGSQAIESFSGGSEFQIFYGGSSGDVVGFRFTMNSAQAVQSLGVWNGDTLGGGGLDNAHQVGIWDDTQTLIASATVTPSSPITGDFRYESVSPVVLNPGTTYTIGALYTATDDDGYLSNPTVVTNPEVNTVNAVFPASGDLGFVFPTEDSAGNPGRIGPNFIFGDPLPESVPVPALSGAGLAALILLLGVAAVVLLRIRQV